MIDKTIAFLRTRARFFALLILVHLLFARFLTDFVQVEITTHFLPQQILLFFFCVGVWALSWHRKAGVLLIVGVVLVIFARSWLVELAQGARHAQLAPESRTRVPLQVISFNVLTSNEEKPAVVDWLTRSLSTNGANIVFLMEVDRSWEEALRPLEKSLPFSYRIIREDNFGIIVFSSAEIKGVAFDSFPDCEVPVFSGSFTFKEKEIRLIGAHPVPPTSSSYFVLRNECLRVIKSFITAQPSSLVLMGDLNTSPWGPHFPKYMNDPFPLLFRRHTWETMGGIVSTSLDHVLYLGDFQVTGAMIGPDLGSDHRPVVVKLGF